jgi:hypothetical protein
MGTRGRGSSPRQTVRRVAQTTGATYGLRTSRRRRSREQTGEPLAAEDGLDWGPVRSASSSPPRFTTKNVPERRCRPARATPTKTSERYDRPLRVRDSGRLLKRCWPPSRSTSPEPSARSPRSIRACPAPVAQRLLDQAQGLGDISNSPIGVDHHRHRVSLELRREPGSPRPGR